MYLKTELAVGHLLFSLWKFASEYNPHVYFQLVYLSPAREQSEGLFATFRCIDGPSEKIDFICSTRESAFPNRILSKSKRDLGAGKNKIENLLYLNNCRFLSSSTAVERIRGVDK